MNPPTLGSMAAFWLQYGAVVGVVGGVCWWQRRRLAPYAHRFMEWFSG